MTKYITVQEAAKIMNCSPGWIYALLKQKDGLTKHFQYGVILLDRDEVVARVKGEIDKTTPEP